MTTPDGRLLQRLSAMLDGTDPPPAEVIDSAAARRRRAGHADLAAYEWRNPDAQLAQLIAATPPATAGVRGSSAGC